jgi:hypothetical protein
MTPRNSKFSGLELVSFVVACLSLAVSGLAGGVSYFAWKRPLPPDPTNIPRFQGEDPKDEFYPYGTIDGTRFFRFLEENSHRKIYIIANIDESKVRVIQDQPLMSTSFEIPYECTPEEKEEGKCEVRTDKLVIKGTGEGKPGLEFSAGWLLRGYFANSGKVSHRQGQAQWEITAIDIVSAVS